MKNKKITGSLLAVMLSVSMVTSAGAAGSGTGIFSDGVIEGGTQNTDTEITVTPELSVTDTPETSPTPEASVTSEPELSVTPEPELSVTPEPELSVTPEPELSVTPEPELSATPEPELSVTPTPEPTPTPVVEEPEDPSQPIRYGEFLFHVLENETVGLSSYEGNDSEVVIPEAVNGKKVVSIMTFAFREKNNIQKVVIPDGVKYIGQYAFDQCSDLTEVVLPDSVIEIQEGAFANCVSLKSLSLSVNVRKIERGAFSNCPILVLDLDEENPYYNSADGMLYTEDMETLVACIGNKEDCIVPESVKKIAPWAFGGGEIESIKFENPECEFVDNAPGISTSTGIVIYGYSGTDAEKYALEHNLEFVSLSPVDIADAAITIAKTSYAYTGKEIKAAVTVKYGKAVLEEGTDYTVTYKNNVKLGTATVIVEGKGGYTGKKEAGTFKIVLGTPILNSAVSTGYNSAKITWKAVAGARTYSLWYKGGTVKNWKKIKDGITGTSYKHTSNTRTPLTTGTTYTYMVKAVNGKNTSSYNKTGISVKIIPATVKLGKVTSEAYNKQKITWSKTAGATGYAVYQRINGKWKWLGTTRTTSYINTNSKAHPVLTGVTNTYTVRAYRKVGSKKIYSAYPKTGISGKALLKTPVISRITKTTSGLKLQWSKISGAAGYVVQRYSSGKWVTIKTIKNGSTLTYTDKKAKKGTKYKYRIAAYCNANGKPFYSLYSSVKSGKR